MGDGVRDTHCFLLENGLGLVLAGSSGQHQLSLGVLAGWGVGARPKVRRTMTVAAVTMAAASPEV